LKKYIIFASKYDKYGLIVDEALYKLKFFDLDYWTTLSPSDFPIIKERYSFIELIEFYD